MKIDHLILGAYETNCYILRESATAKDCLIVDAGLEAGHIFKVTAWTLHGSAPDRGPYPPVLSSCSALMCTSPSGP